MNVRAETLARLAQAMGRSCDDLLGLKPPDALAPRVAELEAALAASEKARKQLRKAFALLGLEPGLDDAGLGKPR